MRKYRKMKKLILRKSRRKSSDVTSLKPKEEEISKEEYIKDLNEAIKAFELKYPFVLRKN